jgi:hypothetical protein
MSEEVIKKLDHPADTNGDGKVSDEEHEMYLDAKRKELEDADAMRDAQRNMTWFASRYISCSSSDTLPSPLVSAG